MGTGRWGLGAGVRWDQLQGGWGLRQGHYRADLEQNSPEVKEDEEQEVQTAGRTCAGGQLSEQLLTHVFGEAWQPSVPGAESASRLGLGGGGRGLVST